MTIELREILSPLQAYTLTFLKEDHTFEEIKRELNEIDADFLNRFLSNLVKHGWLTFQEDSHCHTFGITTAGLKKLSEALEFFESLRPKS